MKLTHVRLLVNDYKACFRFYRDVLGLTPTFGDEDAGYADFDAGDVALALFARGVMAEALGTQSLPERVDMQDAAALVWAVEDVDAAASTVRQRGGELVAVPQDRPQWGIRTAHLRDPDGNLIELYTSLSR